MWVNDERPTAAYKEAKAKGLYHETAAEREVRLALCFGEAVEPETAAGLAAEVREASDGWNAEVAARLAAEQGAENDAAEIKGEVEELLKALKGALDGVLPRRRLVAECEELLQAFAMNHNLSVCR